MPAVCRWAHQGAGCRRRIVSFSSPFATRATRVATMMLRCSGKDGESPDHCSAHQTQPVIALGVVEQLFDSTDYGCRDIARPFRMLVVGQVGDCLPDYLSSDR